MLLGAGCPMAIRDAEGNPLIPGIDGLTATARHNIVCCDDLNDPFTIAESQLKEDGNPKPNVEHFLTHIRGLRAVVGNGQVRGLSAEQLDRLDEQICGIIHRCVNQELPNRETAYHNLALWANGIPRDHPVEIFTTNYDLLLEQAFEECRVPYYDGFSGVRRPIFDPRAIEDENSLPMWARLWKLHGSINWYQNSRGEVFRGTENEPDIRRVIHPSHLKYQESRRMPYLAMVDRLRTFLNHPSAALIICGYSFGDDHINDTIIQGLQYAQTSVAFALMFGPIEDYTQVVPLAQRRQNLVFLAQNGGVIGGRRFDWAQQPTSPDPADETDEDADDHDTIQTTFGLGDFGSFGQFLRDVVGDSGLQGEPFVDAI